MNKKLNIIIVILLVMITILLLWRFVFSREKEIIFNVIDNMEIKVGNNEIISYELSEDLNITWESDNSEVATVNDGIVTGISLGQAVIKGTVEKKGQKITKNISVNTYIGEKEVSLSDVIIPEGELFITKGDTYDIPISYNPVNSYITSIDYSVSDSNILDFNGNVVTKNIGVSTITITINKSISKSVIVNVLEEKINPTFSNKINEVNVDEDNIVLKPLETKKINYTIIPDNAFVKSVKWESNDEKIITVDDGIITAKSSGEGIVKLIINDEIVKEIKVFVSVPVTGLSIISNPKIVLKVGEQATIKTTINPSNATNKNIKYTSTGGVSIDSNGVVTGTAPVSGMIKVSTEDGNYSGTVSYVVNPQKGIVNNAGGIWGYTSPLDKVPNRMDASFFQKLASSGKGTLSDNIYIYSYNGKTYKYDIAKSTLNADGRNVLTRIYYPPGVDLSMVNTFTFMGGTGERSLSGYFSHLDKNREEMKSSGIIALVSTKTSYYEKDAKLTTEFIKSIVGQKSGMKNSVGVYSMSGQCSGEAANLGIYDRLFVINSYINYSQIEKLNIDVVVFSPKGDSMLRNTKTTLNYLYKYRNNRITIITNNGELYNDERYTQQFLVINPGNQMGSGHGYVNISKANVFAYACS